MIRVLVCEDSVAVSQLLVELINNITGEAQFLVVGVAGNGSEAVELTMRLRPDVIAMDVRMPVLDGLEATRRIMADLPTPIVLVSEIAETDVALSMEALAAGALQVLPKPHGPGHPDFEADATKLRDSLLLMSGVRVVRHWFPGGPKPAGTPNRFTPPVTTFTAARSRNQTAFSEQQRLVAIGSSTGGPSALSTILRGLPDDFNWPILITQHIMPGFAQGLAHWLSQVTKHRVVMAEENMLVEINSGQIIMAPDNAHLALNPDHRLTLVKSGPINGIIPSIDVMFESIARSVNTTSVVGILLTGMGRDGATGLKLLHDRGATTLVQDEASSVVFGMPKEAIALGAAGKILPLSKMSEELSRLYH